MPSGPDHWRAMALEAVREALCGLAALAAVAVFALVLLLAGTP